MEPSKKVAILVTDGFEQVELTEPKQALERAGIETEIVSPAEERVRGWDFGEWGEQFPVDVAVGQAEAKNYTALLLPGGVLNSDKLRMDTESIRFIRAFFQADKVVAAICHGPWTLIEAKVVEGRTLTSYPAVKTDLINAGANWIDEKVVVDDQLITSRRPDDLPAFNRAIIDKLTIPEE